MAVRASTGEARPGAFPGIRPRGAFRAEDQRSPSRTPTRKSLQAVGKAVGKKVGAGPDGALPSRTATTSGRFVATSTRSLSAPPRLDPRNSAPVRSACLYGLP